MHFFYYCSPIFDAAVASFCLILCFVLLYLGWGGIVAATTAISVVVMMLSLTAMIIIKSESEY